MTLKWNAIQIYIDLMGEAVLKMVSQKASWEIFVTSLRNDKIVAAKRRPWETKHGRKSMINIKQSIRNNCTRTWIPYKIEASKVSLGYHTAILEKKQAIAPLLSTSRNPHVLCRQSWLKYLELHMIKYYYVWFYNTNIQIKRLILLYQGQAPFLAIG